MTPSPLKQLTQHPLTLINPILVTLGRQPQKLTGQKELLEPRVKYFSRLVGLLRCKGPFQWELGSRPWLEVTLHADTLSRPRQGLGKSEATW